MTPKEELQRHLSECLRYLEGTIQIFDVGKSPDGRRFRRRVEQMEQMELDGIRGNADNIYGRLIQAIELLEKL